MPTGIPQAAMGAAAGAMSSPIGGAVGALSGTDMKRLLEAARKDGRLAKSIIGATMGGVMTQKEVDRIKKLIPAAGKTAQSAGIIAPLPQAVKNIPGAIKGAAIGAVQGFQEGLAVPPPPQSLTRPTWQPMPMPMPNPYPGGRPLPPQMPMPINPPRQPVYPGNTMPAPIPGQYVPRYNQPDQNLEKIRAFAVQNPELFYDLLSAGIINLPRQQRPGVQPL